MLLQGLTSATYTPMTPDGELNLSVIPDYVEYLIGKKLNALYVCGTTGEGISLTTDERKKLVDAFVTAVNGRIPVVVQVGANSVPECVALAAHAQRAGANAISATAPSYYKVTTETALLDFMKRLAAGAADLPFYYYHIPSFTGAALDMARFLKLAESEIPNLAGLKYTDTKVFEYQECLTMENGRFEVLWGCDEMLLSALVVGAKGGIGSTYALIPSVYQGILGAWERGDLPTARYLQLQSWKYVRWCNASGPFHAVQKYLLSLLGLEMGPCRVPLGNLSDAQKTKIAGEYKRYLDSSQEA
ncbi:MAG: dihydrodipicolinate synthase family protein [Planctomycetia bacterium]|nr:dihydrodipicolinate synthase family protein [Planctomycetia bacterium]